MGEGEGEKRKEGFSPSPLSLFRFHLTPFPQKRLILRLDFAARGLGLQCRAEDMSAFIGPTPKIPAARETKPLVPRLPNNVWIFIAQLVEHCSTNARTMGSNTVAGISDIFSG